MPPDTPVGLLILIASVLPGALYTWAFERQVSSFGVTFADRLLRFVALSLLFHLVLGWPEFLLYRALVTAHHVASGQFAAVWEAGLLVFAVPAGVGTVLGGLYATRSTRQGWTRVRRRLTPAAEERILRVALGRMPAPRAWDDVFSDRPTAYVRIWTADGAWVAGRFASGSCAAGFPHEPDLYLEEAWDIGPDGTLGDRALG